MKWLNTEVCKTSIHRFESGRRLHIRLRPADPALELAIDPSLGRSFVPTTSQPSSGTVSSKCRAGWPYAVSELGGFVTRKGGSEASAVARSSIVGPMTGLLAEWSAQLSPTRLVTLTMLTLTNRWPWPGVCSGLNVPIQLNQPSAGTVKRARTRHAPGSMM